MQGQALQDTYFGILDDRENRIVEPGAVNISRSIDVELQWPTLGLRRTGLVNILACR